MKIAYLISGHPKTYQECIDTFINNLSGDSTEVYSHFWWDNSYQNKCYKQHFSEKYESIDLGKKIVGDFKVKDFIIERGKNFDLSFFKKFTKNTLGEQSDNFYKIITPLIIYGLLSQTYSAYQSYLLSQERGSEFDVVIKSRPDLIISKNINSILENLDLLSNKIFFQSSLGGGHLYAGEFPNKPCDWFFAGNPKVMGDFLKNWHECIPEKYSNGILHTNELVQYVCNELSLEIELVDFGALIYKQATNYYDLYHNKIEIYLEDFNFDISKPNNYSIWPYWVEDVNFDHFKNITF